MGVTAAKVALRDRHFAHGTIPEFHPELLAIRVGAGQFVSVFDFRFQRQEGSLNSTMENLQSNEESNGMDSDQKFAVQR